MAQQLTSLTSIQEDKGSIPDLPQWIKDLGVAMSHTARRHSSDPELLWLWHRPGATAPIRPPAWEPPCAEGAALEEAKEKKRKKENNTVTVL